MLGNWSRLSYFPAYFHEFHEFQALDMFSLEFLLHEVQFGGWKFFFLRFKFL